MTAKRSFFDRVSGKIKRSPDGCWLWQGFLTLGYGQISVDGKNWCAHRYVYTEMKGDVSPALELDHLCRNPACVNPDHLEPVTHSENMKRSPIAGRHLGKINRAKTHCPKGHPYSGENVYMKPEGGRRCRACRRKERS